MISRHLTAVVSAAAFALSAGAATAASVATFDLTANYWLYVDGHWVVNPDYGLQGNSFSLTEGDLTAEFSGNYFNPVIAPGNEIVSATVGEGQIGRYGNGAGVTNADSDNSHQVDGSGYKDFIEVEFSQDVMLHSIDLAYFHEDRWYLAKVCVERNSWGWCTDREWQPRLDDNDDFRWMYDLSGDGEIGAGDWISEAISEDPFSDFTNVEDTVFAFGAFEHNDAWKLKSVTVKYHPEVVPLPAAGWMLLAGLGGLAAMRRKRAG